MLNPNVETYLCCDADYEEAQIVLYGAPFDSTTSYRPGTRFGSAAIRRESYGLESYSPYQDKDLLDCKIFDSGDLELSFGKPEDALADIEERAATILTDGKLPFLLGGEHLVTLGAFRAAQAKYSNVEIIHFDAHADLRQEYLGAELSHACVLRRCWELIGDGKIHQFGIRSGDREEFRWGKDHVNTHKFDLDVLDPSVFPGTGTPEPGGVDFNTLREAVTLVCSKANIVGCDVNELSPHYDQSGASTAVACKIVREMMLALHQ